MKKSGFRLLSRIIVIVMLIAMLIVSSQVTLLAEMGEAIPSESVLEDAAVPSESVLEDAAAPSEDILEDEAVAPEEEAEVAAPVLSPNESKPLRIGIGNVQGNFSFFFGETTEDRKIAELTELNVLTNDRSGDIVYQGIDGEIRSYNGADYSYFGPANLDVTIDETNNSTAYTWTLRNDLKFSDGTPLTVDDLIFTFYVLADPSYDGPSTFNTLPIRGLNEYRTQTSSLVYEKYAALWDAIVEAGQNHELPEVSWTKEMEDRVWGDLSVAAREGLELVIAYVDSNYASLYAEDLTGLAPDKLREDDLETALAMSLWGFGAFVYDEADLMTQDPDAINTEVEASDEQAIDELSKDTAESEESPDVAIGYVLNDKRWDFRKGQSPTVEDFLSGTLELYDGDYAALMRAETANVGGKQASKLKEEFIFEFGAQDEEQAAGVPNIAGISRLSETQVEIVLNGYDATAVYKQMVPIAPLHIYGNEEAYDYENQSFGFERGDLTSVRDQSDRPVGAGPYIFQGYNDGVISFAANPYYYRGEPKTKLLQFIETDPGDMVAAVQEDRLDISEPVYSKTIAAEIESYNSESSATSTNLSTVVFEDPGYGYIGLNASTVSVAGDAGSEASKNLRRALAIVLAAERAPAIEEYFGDAAQVIEYPISSTSWAAPQSSDEGYRDAFDMNLQGEAIFIPGMDDIEHSKATLQAATDYLLAAGFTQEDGVFTAAPDGAKLEYTVLIPGHGEGDHPSYAIVQKAADLFEEIGIKLTLVDLKSHGELWKKLQDGTVELWCAAWEGSIDPDPYQIYHSSNIEGAGGAGTNYYYIADDHLDELIMAARSHSDRVFRKDTYRDVLTMILDWAVEVPVYQRQQSYIFSGERIDMATVTTNQTGFYDWLDDIEKIDMN